MKKLLALLPLLGLATSCSLINPTKAPFGQQQQGQAAQTSYGNNPYGVPGQTNTQYQPVNPPYTADIPTSAPAAPTYTPAPPYSPTPTPAPAPISTSSTHTVAPGDSLWAISRKYGTSVDAIQSANGLSNTTIVVGQSLSIPR